MSEMASVGKGIIGRRKESRLETLRGRGSLSLGIDVGSTSSDVVVLDANNGVLFSDYKRTMGRPVEAVQSQLRELFLQINPMDIVLTAATGTAGRFIAKLLEVPFVNEVPAQAAAAIHLYPQVVQATVIEMGGQDSKLIFLSRDNGQTKVRDFALNTICAAGTGSFLDQQAQRLGVNIEDEFGELALQSKAVPRMAGRCSVFAKSDMIHLQQQATPMCDIIAGLCLALARNLKSNLGCGREFVRPIVFTGGVAANTGVVKAIEEAFELEQDELLVPEEHFFTGAIGAVLVAKKRPRESGNGRIDIRKIEKYLLQHGLALAKAPRREALSEPAGKGGDGRVYDNLLAEASEPINAYLGVDVGSISTNVVVLDEQCRVLAKEYLMTAGKPLEAVRRGLEMAGRKVAGKVNILGAATTGSGRYLTGDFIGADVVINEITAQATGATIVNPRVDTIFEIGGQDSKYISLENGVVVDFEMNHACAAGTGSFLEEQAQRLGINIDGEFAALALSSKSPIKLGERCTVFMETDLLNYQQQGAERADLVAGLSYSIVANYLNRVVGRRKIGRNICFQGGTAFNKAVWAAFEKVTGKKITVPPHHEVTGAIGAAVAATERMRGSNQKSRFRGFENLVSVKYSVESFPCEYCPNHCEIKKVQMPGEEPLYYGSRCDRYNLKKKAQKSNGFDAVEFRRRKMLEFAGLSGEKQKDKSAEKTAIGIPMSLIGWQYLPLFGRFFKELGFDVVLSGWTNKQIIRRGVELVTAQTCFPVKVAYGHIAELVDKKADYIFLPSIVSATKNFENNESDQLCPYVQSLAYQVRAAFTGKMGESKILSPVIRMGEGNRLLRKSFEKFGGELGVSASAARKAMKKAFTAQAGFEQALRDKGAEILNNLKPGQKLFVLVSRPYNGCDEGLNLQLPKKLAEMGVEIIPMEMLDLKKAPLGDATLHDKIYWSYGQKILRAAEIIKKDNRLFAIYLSNFSCGPDSFLMTFFRDIMSRKPSLQLELDEHSADAGVITRLEAYFESLKHYKPDFAEQKAAVSKEDGSQFVTTGRTLYIPYMGDAAHGIAACFRSYGQPAQVMPVAGEEGLLKGRQFTSGKECLPCAITTGDMLMVAGRDGFDPVKAAFFMPGGSGPCRFGMYNCMHKLVLKTAGFEGCKVISPNQDGSFYKEFSRAVGGVSTNEFMKSAWTATVGIDLLAKVILRLRPFAKDKQQAQITYDLAIQKWTGAIENRVNLTGLCELMEEIAVQLAMVPVDTGLQKPRIGIVGEIYVRSHPFANSNIIARLEELGAVCDLASLAEWIYYMNFCEKRRAQRKNQLGKLLGNRLRDFVQRRIERKLAEPLEERFGRLAEEDVEHTIELAKSYMDESFEGEAILSIGKTVEYHHEGFGGVVNVMPFTCMPSTIVSSQTMRISSDCANMPILNLSFDGQEDVTLTTRLEAFVEQVASRQKSKMRATELIAAK